MEKKMEEKLQVLIQLPTLLNENQILWAVGGSLLLYFNGLVCDFHDLDLMIDEHACEQVARLFSPLGIRHPQLPSPQFHTQCFMEFTISGVEIDVIGNLRIEHEGQIVSFPLQSEEIEGQIMLGGQRIPLHSLRQWERCYALMGRTEKAAMLRRAREAEELGKAIKKS